MEPALPLPLRLELAHAPVRMEHSAVSESIALFLAQYAARTGTHNATTDEASATGSTGGVVAAQLTRLANGLNGKIDYDAFSALLSSNDTNEDEVGPDQHAMQEDEIEIPAEILEHSPQLHLPSSAPASPEKKDKKPKKDKKEKKDKKDKKEKKDKVKHESS